MIKTVDCKQVCAMFLRLSFCLHPAGHDRLARRRTKCIRVVPLERHALLPKPPVHRRENLWPYPPRPELPSPIVCQEEDDVWARPVDVERAKRRQPCVGHRRHGPRRRRDGFDEQVMERNSAPYIRLPLDEILVHCNS
eukprot:6074645-Pleurochrysis_carterae.AAC.2